MTVVVRRSDAVHRLRVLAHRGQESTTAEIVIPFKDGNGIRLVLADVLISGISVHDSGAGDPLHSLKLSFKRRSVSHEPPPPPPHR